MRNHLTQAIQPGRTLLRQFDPAGILVPASPAQVVGATRTNERKKCGKSSPYRAVKNHATD